MILVIAFIISLIPSFAIYFCFKRIKKEEEYKASCKQAMIKGLLCVFPVIALSAIFALIKNLLFKDVNPIIYSAIHTFIVLALAEELAKYFAGRKVINAAMPNVSWLDMIVFMGIVGIGFGLAEDIPYAIGASVPVMLVRGIAVGHGVYGMLCGYFLGKGFKEGKDIGLGAIIVSLILHGLYDFSLEDSFLALHESTAFLPVTLALIELILLIVMLVFVFKQRKNEKYTASLFPETPQDI